MHRYLANLAHLIKWQKWHEWRTRDWLRLVYTMLLHSLVNFLFKRWILSLCICTWMNGWIENLGMVRLFSWHFKKPHHQHNKSFEGSNWVFSAHWWNLAKPKPNRNATTRCPTPHSLPPFLSPPLNTCQYLLFNVHIQSMFLIGMVDKRSTV